MAKLVAAALTVLMLTVGLSACVSPTLSTRSSFRQMPAPAGPPRILIVVPEEDTITTSSASYELSGSTAPGNSVALNGGPLKVYPSGAFVSLMKLVVGENLFTVAASDDSGRTSTRAFLVIRLKPPETSSRDSLVIEDAMIQPSRDAWLDKGDVLQVQCKGTPGCTASFMNGLPMQEVPQEETGGIGGIYRGVYRVGEHDTLHAQPITFQLQDSSGHAVTRTTRALVSFMEEDFPLVGVTMSDRQALYYGLGADRLGGAVLSFLGPGVRLAITGKQGRLCRVALSPDQQGWINANTVELQPKGTFPPSSLIGSWNVYGEGNFDYVTLSLSDKLPYASIQESEPSRICVDIYGATSNTNWITQQLSTKEIRNAYFEQVSKDRVRVTLELRHRQVWGYAIGYRGTMMVIRVKHQPEDLSISHLVFALDAGHGGSADGAVGATGAKEKDINLATVMHLKKILEEKGAKVVLTRSADVDVAMSDRLKTAVDAHADILISVHSNSIGSTSDPEATRGVSTYYKYICYRPLSVALLESVLKAGLRQFGNVGNFNFSLNSPTEMPNALVELAFMSNPEDEMLLLDDGFREKLAERIVDGVENFLDACRDD